MEEILASSSKNSTLVDKDLENFLPISQIDSSNKNLVVEQNTTTGGTN
jgi:hypothetical protein